MYKCYWKGGPCISFEIIFHKCPEYHLKWHAIAVTDPFVGKTMNKFWNTKGLEGHFRRSKTIEHFYSSSKKITQVEVGSLWDTFYFFSYKKYECDRSPFIIVKDIYFLLVAAVLISERIIRYWWFLIIIAIMVPALKNIIILKPTQWIEVSQENLSPHFSFWRQARNLDERFSESKC